MANFLLFTSLSILLLASTCSSARRILDEQPINPNDPNVVAIAKFAVEERNKQAKTNFELVKVNSGETVVLRVGTVYEVDISVTESQVITTRLVAVLVHSDGSKQLISFD